jgi:hypothetical protein
MSEVWLTNTWPVSITPARYAGETTIPVPYDYSEECVGNRRPSIPLVGTSG